MRLKILQIHLAARGQSGDKFDLHQVAAAAQEFSGAEIEQAVVAALYAAHAQDTTLTTQHLLQEIARTRPLSIVMSERLATLRQWASARTVSAD